MKNHTSIIIVAVLIILGVWLLKGSDRSDVQVLNDTYNTAPENKKTDQVSAEEENTFLYRYLGFQSTSTPPKSKTICLMFMHY